MKIFLVLLGGSVLSTTIGILADIPSGWGTVAVSAAFVIGCVSSSLVDQ